MSRKSAADIASQLRRSIQDGEYLPNDRLPPSRELAANLGIARNTLREAIYRLQDEGLLETRRGSGTIVSNLGRNKMSGPMEDATPLELIDARFALEPHICRLCVLHGRREQPL